MPGGHTEQITLSDIFDLMEKAKSPLDSSNENVAVTLGAYEQIYADYVSSNRLLNDDVKRSLDLFIGYLNGPKVLDVGCAGGRETEYLAGSGLDASGCDISPSFIEVASKAYPNCHFFVADMRHLKSDAQYYGIWCNAAFLHIPKSDALGTLKGFNRLLRAHGVLYLSVMRGNFEGLRENKNMHWPARHFSEYEQAELDHLASEAGFTKIKDSSNETDWGPVFLHGFYRKS